MYTLLLVNQRCQFLSSVLPRHALRVADVLFVRFSGYRSTQIVLATYRPYYTYVGISIYVGQQVRRNCRPEILICLRSFRNITEFVHQSALTSFSVPLLVTILHSKTFDYVYKSDFFLKTPILISASASTIQYGLASNHMAQKYCLMV